MPDALVQHVEITDDRARAAERVTRVAQGAVADDVLTAPFALLGTLDQIEEEVDRHRERWGIRSYVVREGAIDAVSALIARARL
jgi:hypothetical protein